MSIKRKLILLNIVFIFVPIFFFILAIWVGGFFFRDVYQSLLTSYSARGYEIVNIFSNAFGGRVWQLFLICLVLIVILITASNATITYLATRSILKPLSVLKKAAAEIGEGNLDNAIEFSKSNQQDEFYKVFSAFEEMRVRLKDSVDKKLEYEADRRHLVASISHDLKTPITSIQGYVEGILDGVANTPQKQEKYLRTIYQKAEDINRLVDQLFLLSKLDLEQVGFAVEKVRVMDYVDDVWDELRPEALRFGVELEKSCECANDTVVEIDTMELKRVLQNIINNSIKYKSPDRERCILHLHISENPRDVILKMTDNGKGINAADLPHVFDKFYRGDQARVNPGEGSGLGLCISKQIVESQGGSIWVRSIEGEYTSIYLSLPKRVESQEGSKDEEDTDC